MPEGRYTPLIEPFYSDDLVTIYHGDCREIVPELVGVDAVVTDPPYGLSFRGNGWDQSIPDWLGMAQSIAPVVVFTTAPTTLWDYPRPDWVACWARPASNSRASSGGFNHWSPVVIYGKVKLPVDLLSLHAIQHATDAWVTHPSPKPVQLMTWLIVHAVPMGGTVLDPFMGSGSTLIAAKSLGRRAIGIEIEEKYCAEAVHRLAQGVIGLGDGQQHGTQEPMFGTDEAAW